MSQAEYQESAVGRAGSAFRRKRDDAGLLSVRSVVMSAFFVLMILSVALSKLAVAGAPVRALFAAALLGLLALLQPRQMMTAFRKHRNTVCVILMFAALGAVVTIANKEVRSIWRGLCSRFKSRGCSAC